MQRQTTVELHKFLPLQFILQFLVSLSHRCILFNCLRWTLHESDKYWEFEHEPCSLNIYANLGLFFGVSMRILFTVINGDESKRRHVTIWMLWLMISDYPGICRGPGAAATWRNDTGTLAKNSNIDLCVSQRKAYASLSFQKKSGAHWCQWRDVKILSRNLCILCIPSSFTVFPPTYLHGLWAV